MDCNNDGDDEWKDKPKPGFGGTRRSSGGDVSGSVILRYNFPEAGSISWEDTADSAVPTHLEYRQPNQFGQMSNSEKVFMHQRFNRA